MFDRIPRTKLLKGYSEEYDFVSYTELESCGG